MTSTSSRLSETVQNPPVFSYAQAAKGRTSSTTTSAQQTNQTSGVSTPQKDSVSVTDVSVAGSEKGTSSVNGSNYAASRADTTGDASSSERKEPSASKEVSIPASPSVGTASTSTLPKEEKDDDFVLVGQTDPAKEKHLHNSNQSERTDEREGRRGKKSKKQKNAEKEAEKEKEKEEVKQEVLVPAPIPSVNIWQQRKDVAAKSKPVDIAPTLVDAKALAKVSPDGGNRSNATAANPRDTGRGQRKSIDGSIKAKEESTRRVGPRGSRSGDVQSEGSSTTQVPPSVGDAALWPTPETVLEEDKRKAQEKSEKEEREEPVANKPRPKDKWVAVPYIPTVTFNTPMPTRGARGRGGGRGGRTDAAGRSSTTNGEKSVANATTAPAAVAENGSVVDGESRNAPIPVTNNRQSNEQTGTRRKSSSVLNDRNRNELVKTGLHASTDIRLQNQDTLPGVEQDHSKSDTKSKQEIVLTNGVEATTQPKSNRQNESNLRGGESNQTSRERNEGRSDRGRGGFRGRGGHINGFANGQHSQHNFVNGHSQMPNGFPIRQSTGPYSPPLQQPPFSNQYPAVPSRNNRNTNGSRSQSIPNNNGVYRGYGATQHMPPLQNPNQMYDYSMQPLSAGPYNYQIDNSQIISMVTIQLDYYFSIDNLCKDVFLRKHMDSKGFVFLSFIAGFKRIQSLSQDFELLKSACMASEIIESVKGDDGHERLRRREGWEKWVLPAMEERDESARHAGPTHFIPLIQALQQSQRVPPHLMTANHFMAPPQPFSSNGTDQMYRPPYTNGSGAPASNGTSNGYHHDTPLSAAVADFAPGTIQTNGHHDPLQSEVTFSDEAVDTLKVLTRPPPSDGVKPKTPFHSFASRTFSNGSIDERSLNQEVHDDGRQSRTSGHNAHVSDDTSKEAHRSRSPYTPLSPTKSPVSYNAPPVMWVKGQLPQPLPEADSGELYTTLRSRALKRRENSNPGETHPDMKILYGFWSHFLVRNFNLSMYYDFRQYALDDTRRDDNTGLTSLITYYDEVLNSKKKVIPETIAIHYVELVKNEEATGDRPAFQKLRAAWRNGALDLKSRKKIDSLVGSQLREELDNGPSNKTSA